MKVTALVPARNEAEQIGETIASLLAQSTAPARIVVVANNCTDDGATAAIARAAGVEVVELFNVVGKKAGALNLALADLLPTLGPEDAVLVMDADSTLDHDFLTNAVRRLDAGFDACGGVFTGKPGGGLVGMFQRNEFARYARDVRRLRGKALVLTGTATLFRASVLTEVVEARRRGDLPGAPTVYDTKVLTEDNELTFALMHLGKALIAPADCALTTDVMTSWSDLHAQRLRWKRGALENLFDYGWTPVTRRYWGRQVLSAVGVVVTVLYWLTLLGSLALTGHLHVHPVWLALTAVFVAEQVITVRSRGLAQMALASTLVVEMLYDLFLQATQGKALWDTALRAERAW